MAEPGLGYYSGRGDRPTRGGDFLTAPELHPWFGRIVGRQLTQMWERIDRPARFVLREFGAGRGTLGATIRDGLRADGAGLASALVYEPVDLPNVDARPAAARMVGCILANEFLDALPVHRVVQRGEELREIFVSLDGGSFVDVEGQASTTKLTAHLLADEVSLADGQRAEICLAAPGWLESAARHLARGYIVVIDYGMEAAELYGPRHMAGTLLGYRGHHVEEDPYAAVGATDLTAHVDFTALGRAASAAGLSPAGSTRHAQFVAALGLGELLAELGSRADSDPAEYLLARSSVVRLLDPQHLGGFRVAAWARDVLVDRPLRGFP